MLRPLITRVWTCSICGDRREVFDNACYLAIYHGMLRFHDANLSKANLPLEYLPSTCTFFQTCQLVRFARS